MSMSGSGIGESISGIGGIVTAFIGADASRSATNKQVDAQKAAIATQKEMYEEGRADTAPWREAGANALVTLQEKVAAGPGTYTKSPGYDFRLKEGQNAIENAAAAKGQTLDPSTVKALTRYSQDYATNDYQNFLANYYNSLTPYQSLAQIGQTTSSQNATQGNNVASNIASNQAAIGAAQAVGAINSANSITGPLNTGINNYMMWKYLNSGSNSGSNPSNYNYNYAGFQGQDFNAVNDATIYQGDGGGDYGTVTGTFSG